ncbi:MAG: putative baseplate assembly protein [Actinomycetota bacterium]|nr:putative baseplate assembly protein [Actinomycetota bacterium]
MSLAAPNLDDRRFQDLVDDAKRYVQANCPEWTDHNVSDPGVTLIETFAFMTDQLLYRLNRVPDRMYIKFLDLVGIRLRPPSAATVPITFWLSSSLPNDVTLSAGTRVGTLRSDNEQSVIFSTLRDLEIPSCELSEALVVPGGLESEATAILDSLNSRVEVRMFSDDPQPGDALYLGLDTAVPRCIVRVQFDGRVEGIGVDPKNPPLTWQAWTGSEWVDCSVTLDETGGFNTPGAVLVQLPASHARSVVCGHAAAWLRVRVKAAEDGQPAYRTPPIIGRLGASTAGGAQDAIHAEIVDAEELGEAEGTPGQTFELARGPVLRIGDVVVETSSEDGWQSWEEVESFADSTTSDRHFILDHTCGVVMFGPAVRDADGAMRRYGAVPEKGVAVRIRGYAVGGGRSGNVPAGTVSTLRSSVPFIARVENARAAQGGTDGETLDEAKIRAPMALSARGRAVTRSDFAYFAREAAPQAARIFCANPNTPQAPVRILVVPAAARESGRIQFEDLVPQEETLQRIAERLEQVRLIGTRIAVEPPRYRGVTAVARVRAARRADPETVQRTALESLYDFLSPLARGGPDGQGWPFGRPVQAGELYTVLQRVPGVELVEEVRLFSADPISGARGQEAQRIDIDAFSLVFSFDHHVRVQS